MAHGSRGAHLAAGGSGLVPVVATPRTMALAGGLFCTTGGLLVLALTFGPHSADANLPAVRLLAGGGLLVWPLLAWCRDTAPAWVHHALNLLGSTLITLAIVLSGGGVLGAALCSLFVLVPVHGFAFFHPGVAAAHMGYLTALAALLCWPLDLISPSVLFAGSVVNLLAAGTVAWLVRAAERAEIDGVTGLLNRRGFDRLLEDAWLAHGGSGEFSVLLPGRGVEGAGHILEGLRQTLPHLGTASAGLAEWMPDDTKSLLLSRVDASLYRAKRAGRNRIDPRVGMDVSAREMREALTTDSFRVLYQPIVDLNSEETVGAEALVRWQHPSRGLLNPADFIPLAEESGVIVGLGRFVLEESCRAVAQARRQGRPLETLTVNVSGLQLHQPDYADDVLEILQRTGWEPSRLVLEVTESSLAAEDDVAVAALGDLRAAGIRIAIDDFGTGYSSLSRLAHLPVDILKIDRSFVSSIVPGRPAPIIASITALAQALDLSTVAEGVEHHDQAVVLAQHGCDRGQGWLYGRPVPLETLPLASGGAAAVPAARRSGEGSRAERPRSERPPAS